MSCFVVLRVDSDREALADTHTSAACGRWRND